MTHDEIRRAATAKLKSILKNDDPDVDLPDMIDYELYIREYSSWKHLLLKKSLQVMPT